MTETAVENPKSKARPKWEAETRENLRAHLRRYGRPLADLVERDANEGDTRLLVTDVLTDAFGYDKYADLTTEYAVRGEFADYGVRIDQQLVAFIEVKRVTTKLTKRHLRQIEMYAVNEGVEWLILTNGVHWQVYRLIPGMPVTVDRVLDIDLLDPATTLGKKVDAMFWLTKESFKRGQIEAVWQQAAATAPKALAEALLSDVPLDAIRKEVRRRTKVNIDVADLARLLRDDVLREELTK